MCTDITHTTAIEGRAYARGDWIDVGSAVVTFDHPVEMPLEHALCIDLRQGSDPAARVAVELDEASARSLAEAILRALP